MLAEIVRDRLRAMADPERAKAQQAYLKTEQPIIGVGRPAFRALIRELARTHPPADRAAWERDVAALWEGPERDLQWAAVDWAQSFRRRRFVDLAAVPLFERMVREGAWWDLVDGIAVKLVGQVVADHREEMRPVLLRWIEDPDLWIRRTALLAQHDHRAETDTDMLLDFCRRQASDKSFWIRKAIGWVLRQHAKTDPALVRAFLAEQGDRLSGLSRREAAKHLGW
jgi:3-methyladenine DNA glycosylase AlkD